jgi:hypothetical protein
LHFLSSHGIHAKKLRLLTYDMPSEDQLIFRNNRKYSRQKASMAEM